VKRPGSREPVADELRPFIRFFRQRRELLREARVVADVAVLRSFSSQVFGGPRFARITSRVEEALIRNRVCFQIIHDHQLADLRPPTVLVLAGCVAMSDRQAEQIKRFVRQGGRLCVFGPLATHNQWMQPRQQPALDDLPKERVVHVEADGDPIAALERARDGGLSLRVDGPDGLCAELTEQPGRRLVHLVNYRTDRPAENVEVCVRTARGRAVRSIVLASPEHSADIRISFDQDGDRVCFVVPQVKTYEIAVVNWR